MTDGNMTGCNVEDHFWNEKRIIPGNAIAFGEVPDFFLESIDSPNATREYYAYAIAVYIIFCNTGIRNSLIAYDKGCLGKTVQFPCFLFIQEAERIVILQLAG